MKSFKQILSEAYERRLYRLSAAEPKARAAVERKFGTSSFEELGDMGHLDYDNENPYDLDTHRKEWEEWDESHADEPPSFSSNTPAEIRRYGGIVDSRVRAEGGMERRDIQIADKLKSSNPDLYRTYISRAKEDIIPAHDAHLKNIERRIKSFEDHIQIFRNMNAPQRLIDGAIEAHKKAKESYDSAGEVMQSQIHKRIGQLHAQTLRRLYDPNDGLRGSPEPDEG